MPNNALLRSICYIRQSVHDCKKLVFSKSGWGALLLLLAATYLHYSNLFSLWRPQGYSGPALAWWHAALFMVFWWAGFGLQKLQSNGWVLLLPPLVFALKIHLPFAVVWFTGNQQWSGADRLTFQWLAGSAFILLLLLLLRRLQQKRNGWYGLAIKPGWQLSLLLLLGMIPLAGMAAAASSFEQLYPRYQIPGAGSAVTGWKMVVFESAYLLDLLSVEVFFRGLLVLGLVRSFGQNSILPMALFYFAIHLGKPWPEAVSSFFGGVMLGFTALRSGSIWYGWIAHAGLALLLELWCST